MDLQEIKAYLRVDTDAEDATIQSFIDSAAAFIKQSTGKAQVKKEEDFAAIELDPLFNLCIKMLTAQWFECRGVDHAGANIKQYSYSVDSMLQHIANCGDYTP